jgi:hypothetical protein
MASVHQLAVHEEDFSLTNLVDMLIDLVYVALLTPRDYRCGIKEIVKPLQGTNSKNMCSTLLLHTSFFVEGAPGGTLQQGAGPNCAP